MEPLDVSLVEVSQKSFIHRMGRIVQYLTDFRFVAVYNAHVFPLVTNQLASHVDNTGKLCFILATGIAIHVVVLKDTMLYIKPLYPSLTRLPPRESTQDGRWTRKPFGLSRVQPIYLNVPRPS